MSLPLYGNGFQTGTLTLCRSEESFTEYEILAAEIAVSLCTLILRQLKEQTQIENKRRADAVKAVVNTLSFSELEAVIRIIEKLEGGEGLLIAGHIADSLKITRSVVVNALRKLEGSGMVETRSLGMKGTYIRVIDPLLADEIKKFKR